jgi:hypothetical protein
MPCCTLIAFLLSQLGLAGGALKVRLSGMASFVRFVPAPARDLCLQWRWAGLATLLTVELLMAGAVAPYVVTQQGRADAVRSFTAAARLCAIHPIR